MNDIPVHIPAIFIAISLSVFCFILFTVNTASPERKNFTPTIVGTFLISWLFVIALLASKGFFLDFTLPAFRFFGFVALPSLTIISLFFFPRIRAFYLKAPIVALTFLHIIRIPVELVLWWLSKEKMIPVEMTFEGHNFDIFIGVTAPFAGIFLVGSRSRSRFAAILWNIIGIGFLLHIVIMAIRATPYFYDATLFPRPNTAIFYFPFTWLPTFVVPAVLWAHLVSLYQLLFKQNES